LPGRRRVRPRCAERRGRTGTPVVAQDQTGNPNQIWRFQRVGWIAVSDDTANVKSYIDADRTIQAGVALPVYKIVNYSGQGGHTCLDATGNSPGVGAAVTSYTCDPYLMNQSNQLWMLAGRWNVSGDMRNLPYTATRTGMRCPTKVRTASIR
jgi:hypothetical protein